MASVMSFLTRRQADRTILIFGICVFIFQVASPNYFVATVLATSPRPEQAEKLFRQLPLAIRDLRTQM